jgi:hypothetical protein
MRIPHRSLLTAYRSGDHIFHAPGEFTLEAPTGKMTIEAVKGFEYWPAKQEVEIRSGEVARVTLVLKGLVDMPAKGWYSGSTHAHMNYGGNLRNTLEHMMLMARAEDAQVALAMAANKDNRIMDWEYFVPGGAGHPISKDYPRMAVIVAEEYRPPFWGHTFLIGLRDHLISPFTTGYEGTAIDSLYPSNTDMFRKAKAQGAITGYVHAFAGEGDPLNRSLGGAKEFPVDVAWDGGRGGVVVIYARDHAGVAPRTEQRFPGGGDRRRGFNTSLHRHTMPRQRAHLRYLGTSLDARGWIDSVGAGRSFVAPAARGVPHQPALPGEVSICRREAARSRWKRRHGPPCR